MTERTASVCAAAATAVAAALCLAWWLDTPPRQALELRLPGRNRLASATQERVDMAGSFLAFDGVPSSIRSSWPRFRGPGFDNISAEAVTLADQWPPEGPPVLWEIELGEGHAGPAVRNGRVYVLDYDETEEGDSLRCFSLDDGREIWRRWYGVRIKRNHGMSRTVPAVTDRFVVTVGPKCHVMCVDAVTGDYLWGLDLVSDFGSGVPLWYTAQCPLIDGDVAVIAPAGRVMMMGVDCASGETVWESPNPRGWSMSHSSVMPMTFAGRKMYVYAAVGGIVGVAADGPQRGSVLWETDAWDPSVVSPSPVQVGDDRILMTSGYGAGSVMLRVAESDGDWTVTPEQRLDRSVFACEQHTPVVYGGHAYSVLPNDAGAGKRQLVCMNFDGNVVWSSGKTDRFGLGPFLVADSKLLVLDDSGVLTMARASATGYERLAQVKVLHGRDAWAPMAIVDGRLLLRDWKRLVCLDLRGRPGGGADIAQAGREP